MSTAQDFLRRKTNIPSELLTADWRDVESWIKERAFFMAGVEEARVLEDFRDLADRRAAGEISPTEARELAQARLEKMGYAPRDGEAGTIKDLQTSERQNVSIETNVEAARGFALRARQQEVLGAFPAWDYVRMRHSKVERNWRARWTAAGGGSPGSTHASSGRMAALVNHPIWTNPAFNVLGNKFPPFDFNSGMGVEALDREEAAALGLLAGDVGRMLEPDPVLMSLNADLQLGLAIRREETWEHIYEDLQGFAYRSPDNALLFTDPNGTRPYPAEALAEVVTAPLPRGFQNHQRDAVAAWSRNSADILLHPGSDNARHLARLVWRTEPLPPGTPIYRGESFPTEEALRARVQDLMEARELNAIATSFSKDPDVAEKYSRSKGPHQLILRMEDHRAAKSIEETVAVAYPKNTDEREVLFSHKTRVEVVDINEHGPVIEIFLREVRE